MTDPRMHPTPVLHGWWFARFDPRVAVLSVVDDFGNLRPVALPLVRSWLTVDVML